MRKLLSFLSFAFLSVCLAGPSHAQSLDPTFNASVLSPPIMRSMAVEPDGKILISGRFHSVGGNAISYLARFNPDGSFDESFQPENPGA